MEEIPILVVTLALIAGLYVGLDGLGLIGRREQPRKLKGATIVLTSFDSSILTERMEVYAEVGDFDGNAYVLESDIGTLKCSARWKGVPLSKLSSWRRASIPVGLWNQDGESTIAMASTPSNKLYKWTPKNGAHQ